MGARARGSTLQQIPIPDLRISHSGLPTVGDEREVRCAYAIAGKEGASFGRNCNLGKLRLEKWGPGLGSIARELPPGLWEGRVGKRHPQIASAL